ncbi:MAG: hypothetical protein HY016_06105 [Nitrosomonadales bacterium]|nr:hypothetical protein [Nitrosomonadales bacterium]
MKQRYSLFIGLALFVAASQVVAAEGSITITSPVNDAVLQSATENKLAFNVQLSPKGNHVHVYVDDQDPIVVRDVSHCPCSVALPKLSSGKHTIVVKEATAGHAPTGVQGSVTATVK